MRDEEWRGLGDEALERLLIERWLHRGVPLCVVTLAGIVATILGARGVVDLAEQVIIGALVALALAVGALLFTVRQQDLKIHQELRRRRLFRPG